MHSAISWQRWFGYALALLLLSWAPFAGIDVSIITLTALAAAFLHWFARPLASVLFALGAGHSIWLANAEKLRDTGDAILWQDLFFTVPNIADNLGTLWQYVGASGIAKGGMVLALLVMTAFAERRWLRCSTRMGLAFSVLLLAVYLPEANHYRQDIAETLELFRASPQSFAGRSMASSSLARFLHSMNLPRVSLLDSDGDSSAFLRKAATIRPSTAALPSFQGGNDNPSAILRQAVAVTPPAGAAPLAPDIIAVLNESQFDPMQLEECAGRTDCRMKLYSDDRYALSGGPLRVHTHGWGTWNAEFSLMTGIPNNWFGETGFYSPYTVAPRIHQTLGKHLASLGYRTIGIYPTQKGMLNAARAYRQYGINEFFGAEDLGLPLDWCSIPDRLMYNLLLAKYREARAADPRPLFMVMLTVFNHGPHGGGCMDADQSETLSDAEPRRAKIEDFLRRSRDADDAANNFRSVILAMPRPLLLLFAGDHQPSLEGFAASFPRRMHRPMADGEELYFTNYRFFSNRSSTVKPVEGELDISFLPATLLEFAGLPGGPLFEQSRRLRELCSGRLDACPAGLLQSYKAYLAQSGIYK